MSDVANARAHRDAVPREAVGVPPAVPPLVVGADEGPGIDEVLRPQRRVTAQQLRFGRPEPPAAARPRPESTPPAFKAEPAEEAPYTNPALAEAKPEVPVQFERNGYFVADAFDSKPEALVFNKTVGLKDTWAKIESAQQTHLK